MSIRFWFLLAGMVKYFFTKLPYPVWLIEGHVGTKFHFRIACTSKDCLAKTPSAMQTYVLLLLLLLLYLLHHHHNNYYTPYMRIKIIDFAQYRSEASRTECSAQTFVHIVYEPSPCNMVISHTIILYKHHYYRNTVFHACGQSWRSARPLSCPSTSNTL